ncbi:MAG: phosphodiesterase [Myxococcales bacterium]|nr:phosphodiesterase [Myxococcales bacterium]
MTEPNIKDLENRLDNLSRRNQKLQALLEIGKELGAEHNLDILLEDIMSQAREVVEAERVSLFLVDKKENCLYTKIAQDLEASEIRIPIGKGIAGQCAETLEPILIKEAYDDDRFNADIDKKTGYTTHSILTVPMVDEEGACNGVIQALNKRTGGSFDHDDQELLLALGGQAAVAVDNAKLHGDIEQLLEGFIRASVYAIEARDPTTSGHSERVALLTTGLAEAVNRCPPKSLKAVSFSKDQLRELRYAALLHDFGKVGVREPVLIKAKKLYPEQFEVLKYRFAYAKKEREAQFWMRRCHLLEENLAVEQLKQQLMALEAQFEQGQKELDGFWAFIEKCNEPTVLESGGFEKLQAISEVKVDMPHQHSCALLHKDEMDCLSIPRGSLNQEERVEIESHVTHTFHFLRRIPWTNSLKDVPEIAFTHHEKLDGSGYPRGVPAEEIPVQARMMTIADIYDALTAMDRPYKKAMPHGRALDILGMEAKAGKIDPILLDVFIEANIHQHLQKMEANS